MRARVEIAAADPEYIQLAAHMFAIIIDKPFCVWKVKHGELCLVHVVRKPECLLGGDKNTAAENNHKCKYQNYLKAKLNSSQN